VLLDFFRARVLGKAREIEVVGIFWTVFVFIHLFNFLLSSL
jgi:hypothetical protein